jgi:hypothetical protein
VIVTVFGVAVALPEGVPVQPLRVNEAIVYVVAAAGETDRVAGEVVPVCTTPSDQVMLHGPLSLSAAEMVVFEPAQNAPPPETVAVGVLRRVTVNEPLDVPAHVPPSLTLVIVYVVVVAGETVRDWPAAVTVCVKPSLQASVIGKLPLTAGVIVAEPPDGQTVAEPESVADGAGRIVTTAEPLAATEQLFTSFTVAVYVVVEDGETLRVAVVPLFTVCTLPSLQVTVNGALPASVAVIGVDVPRQIVAAPLTAPPVFVYVTLPLPALLQLPLVTDVTLYVVVADGVKFRVSGVVEVTRDVPSLNVTVHGEVPVRSTVTGTLVPALQNELSVARTVAVGLPTTESVVEAPVTLPPQL